MSKDAGSDMDVSAGSLPDFYITMLKHNSLAVGMQSGSSCTSAPA